MNFYAEYSLTRKGWYVYQEFNYSTPTIFEGPYTKEKAHKRAQELNEDRGEAHTSSFNKKV